MLLTPTPDVRTYRWEYHGLRRVTWKRFLPSTNNNKHETSEYREAQGSHDEVYTDGTKMNRHFNQSINQSFPYAGSETLLGLNALTIHFIMLL